MELSFRNLNLTDMVLGFLLNALYSTKKCSIRARSTNIHTFKASGKKSFPQTFQHAQSVPHSSTYLCAIILPQTCKSLSVKTCSGRVSEHTALCFY